MLLGENDVLEEIGVLHEDPPIERDISLHLILVGSCIFGGLAVADEEEVVLLILRVH
jgi:hypothetical protein